MVKRCGDADDAGRPPVEIAYQTGKPGEDALASETPAPAGREASDGALVGPGDEFVADP